MVIRHLNTICCFSVLWLVSISSCSTSNVSSDIFDSFSNDYEISEVNVTKDKKIIQVGSYISGKIVKSIDVKGLYLFDYGYPFFFDGECAFSKDECIEFANKYNYTSTMADELYTCSGTNYTSYCKYTFLSDYTTTLKLDESLEGVYCVAYTADTVEYNVKVKGFQC